MSSSNWNPKLTARTPLLTKLPPEPIDEPEESSGFKNGSSDQEDVENPPFVEVDNPLFEGNPELAKQMYILFPAVAIGILLSAADQTIIATTYGRIGSDLDALNNTGWIATAYFLTLTSFQPLYGKLSDIFGRKPCLLFAYIVFGVGCLFCGLARNLTELVLARAFAGIGGGGLTTVVNIIFNDIIPLRQRGTWQGYMNIVYALGSGLGAPLGGALADSIGWRWAFIGQFPMTIVAFITVYFALNVPKAKDSHMLEKLGRIDFLGAFSLLVAVLALLFGLDRGSNVAWSDKLTIISTSVAPAFLAIFMFVEVKVASNPFAPGHIIFDRGLFASYLTNFLVMAYFMGLSFYCPLYFQVVSGMSVTQAGLRFIPITCISVSGSLFGGIVMKKTGKYYWLTISCLIVGVLGNVVIFLFSGLAMNSSWGMVAGFCFSAFGGGAVITTTLISVIANVDPKEQDVATACTYLFRSLGSVVGVSLYATVAQQSLKTYLRASLKSGHKADEIVEKVRQSLDYIKTLKPATKAIVVGCYQKATNLSFGIGIGVAVLALVCSCFMREKRLSN